MIKDMMPICFNASVYQMEYLPKQAETESTAQVNPFAWQEVEEESFIAYNPEVVVNFSLSL